MTIWCMHIACWIPKATNTHSEYVTLIAFPLQQWLQDGPSMLRYIYIACLMNVILSRHLLRQCSGNKVSHQGLLM